MDFFTDVGSILEAHEVECELGGGMREIEWELGGGMCGAWLDSFEFKEFEEFFENYLDTLRPCGWRRI